MLLQHYVIGGYNMSKQFIIKENVLSADDYLFLRKSLAWGTYSRSDIVHSLHNTIYTVSVYGKEGIVGAGRLVGDGKICFYIQDVMVVPKFQNMGVGKLVMNHIMQYLHQHAAPNAYIGLMSKIGKEGFYEKYGFISRPNAKMGHGMVLLDFNPIQ